MKKVLALLVTASMVLMTGCADLSAMAEAANAYAAALPAEAEAEAPAEEAAPVAECEDIVILSTNDIHCGVDGSIGYDGLAAVKNAFETEGHPVLLVDAGDFSQGDVIGTLSQGQAIVTLMNTVGYDFAVPGNHEFDYTMEGFFNIVEAANFPIDSCNFRNADGSLVLNPYEIFDVNGVKIAFVGISTPDTLTSSTPKYFMDEEGNFIYNFAQGNDGADFFACIQDAVDSARADGADYVIAVGHCGIDESSLYATSSNIINNTTGIDAFIDGHSHSILNETVKNKDGVDVILTQTGTKFANIGYLSICPTTGELTASILTDASVDGGYVYDVYSELQAANEEMLNEVVAKTDVDLCIMDPATDERMVRSNETNLGDLCSDAYKALSGADIGFVNGGGIRDTILAGDITYGSVIKVHPYGNMLTVVKATGQEIYEALEMSCKDLPGEYGGFLQPSGLTFTVDVNVPSPVVLDENKMFVEVNGDPRVTDILVNGEPLDLTKEYTVASHDYMLLNCGDGYTMFADNEVLQKSVMLDNQVLINFIKDNLGGVVGAEYADPYGEGRINIIE